MKVGEVYILAHDISTPDNNFKRGHQFATHGTYDNQFVIMEDAKGRRLFVMFEDFEKTMIKKP